MSDFDRFEAMSFDCYGTLIDWETGIANALRPWADRNGLELDDQASDRRVRPARDPRRRRHARRVVSDHPRRDVASRRQPISAPR